MSEHRTDDFRMTIFGIVNVRQDVRMPKLNYVWFWPNGGPTEEGWYELGDGLDAFARTSRRVTERYSEGLAAAGIEARRSAVQMMLSDANAPEDRVVLETDVRRPGDEIVRVLVPEAVGSLAPQDRAQLVLDVVDAAMRRIGDARGWPLVELAHAHAHVREHNFTFEMVGPWKSNPSRKRRVRPVAHIADDGWGRLSYEVADSRSGATLGFTRLMPITLNSLPQFKRAIGFTRWRDERTLEREESWLRHVGQREDELQLFDIEELEDRHELALPRPSEITFGVDHQTL